MYGWPTTTDCDHGLTPATGGLGSAATPSLLPASTRLARTHCPGRRQRPAQWPARGAEAEAQLACAEAEPAALRQTIATVLADAPRSGTPSTFSAEQIVQIVNLACTSPRSLGRPVDAWTPRELADEARRQGIVTSISPTSVGRFLGSGRSAAASQPLLAQRQDQGG